MRDATDAQLLDAAAKAAGYTLKWLYMGQDPQLDGRFWNPLTDDGDAFWLAVRLRICIEFGYCSDDAPVVYCGCVEDRRDWPMSQNFPDPRASTRRAIVRAAAALQTDKE